MSDLVNTNTFQFGFVMEVEIMFDDMINNILEEWESKDEDNRYFEFNRSAQSSSVYWSFGSDVLDEICIRISDHECVNCHSKVTHNLNLMKFIEIEEDEDGYSEFDEWFINMEGVKIELQKLLVMILEKI